MDINRDFINFVNDIYKDEDMAILHRPIFSNDAKKYLIECIDSNFVSSVGQRVVDFEDQIKKQTGAKYAIATVNGTSALHIALMLSGVERGTEVLTQAVSFIATCNAISYCGALPVFVDISRSTLGMDPKSLKDFLENNARKTKNGTINSKTGNKISACAPMHTFGHACEIDQIVLICNEWDIPVVEDAAESLGSYYKNKHTGTFGKTGIFSFNGNKIVTTGGGGMIVTDDDEIGQKAKHITTTAKITHPYEYHHDMIGYNYRLPNLNAALGCEQMEHLDEYLRIKRELANNYKAFFSETSISYFSEPKECNSNYWLNAVILDNKEQRDEFLLVTNKSKVMTRPIWGLLNKQKMFRDSFCVDLPVSNWLEERIVNIPSSVPNHKLKDKI